MQNVKIVTDSNSGITQAEAEKLGISVVPMPFLIDGETYFEDINLTQEEFYAHLKEDANVSTSQPAIGDLTDLWDRLLEDEDAQIVHIPMSSGLSESCHTAQALARDYGGRVHVVDNQRISITQKESVRDALLLASRGCSAAEIKNYLETTARESSIYITLETLKYLKKGGRLTPAAALIGTLLRIKPVLQIQGAKLDAFRKVTSVKAAKKVMIDAVRSDAETRFAALRKKGELELAIAHTANAEEAAVFAEELRQAFPDIPLRDVDPLSLSVACHIGPGALACGLTHILK